RVVGPALRALVEHGDRLVIAPQVAQAAGHPDQRLRIVGIGPALRDRLGEVGLELLLARQGLRRRQRRAQQRGHGVVGGAGSGGVGGDGGVRAAGGRGGGFAAGAQRGQGGGKNQFAEHRD